HHVRVRRALLPLPEGEGWGEGVTNLDSPVTPSPPPSPQVGRGSRARRTRTWCINSTGICSSRPLGFISRYCEAALELQLRKAVGCFVSRDIGATSSFVCLWQRPCS